MWHHGTPYLPTKLPMYDAGSTGFRRTMPSSPGDALPITANLQTLISSLFIKSLNLKGMILEVKLQAEQNTRIYLWTHVWKKNYISLISARKIAGVLPFLNPLGNVWDPQFLALPGYMVSEVPKETATSPGSWRPKPAREQGLSPETWRSLGGSN